MDQARKSFLQTHFHDLNQLTEEDVKPKISKQMLADFFGIARQTMYKYLDHEQSLKLSDRHLETIDLFFDEEGLDIPRAKTLLTLHSQYQKILSISKNLPISEIEAWTDINRYVAYWPMEKSTDDDYLQKIHYHLNNFHIKANPYYPFFKDYFNKDIHPILTFDIDYNKQRVNNITIDTLINSNAKVHYEALARDLFKSSSYSYATFVKKLLQFSKKITKDSFLMYVDPTYSFFDEVFANGDSTTKNKLKQLKYYDLSRLFRVSEQGHFLETVLHNYNITFEKRPLLSNAPYRMDKLKTLLRMVAGYDMNKQSLMAQLVRRSDGEVYNSENSRSVAKENRRQEIMSAQND